MSAINTPDPPAEPAITAADAPAVAQTEPPLARKSYRRKYRKIMVNFERRMQESNSLFRDEQKIFDISQRLAEQTEYVSVRLSGILANISVNCCNCWSTSTPCHKFLSDSVTTSI